jgi:pimeloyl-ACP methyl ester carboxylesterase
MMQKNLSAQKDSQKNNPRPVDFSTAHSTYRREGDTPMMGRRSFIATSAVGMTLAGSSLAFSQAGAKAAVKSGYAPVNNGLNLYYEIRGTGEPLIVLHGGLGAGEMFAEILPALSSSRRVITGDLQAHGRTADIDRPLDFESMADDVAALAKHLGIETAVLMGYSLGAGVALRTAVRHPGLVNKLVLVSTAFKREGWYPEILTGMSQVSAAAAEPMKQTPMYQMYSRIAPKPADWPVLLTKIGELLRKNYDWSSDIASIKIPTMLAFGDADAVPPAHAAQFFELLGGGKKDGGWDGSGISNSRLAILPGLTHYNIFSAPALASTVISFLDAQPRAAKYAQHVQSASGVARMK